MDSDEVESNLTKIEFFDGFLGVVCGDQKIEQGLGILGGALVNRIIWIRTPIFRGEKFCVGGRRGVSRINKAGDGDEGQVSFGRFCQGPGEGQFCVQWVMR